MEKVEGQLIEKLKTRQAKISIIGLGYVGLPLMLRFAECGYSVLGIDKDPAKIESLKQGRSYIDHIPSQAVQANMDAIDASIDISRVAEADAVIICVPTPLNDYREPDLSFVLKTTDELLPYLHQGQVISLESTTYPGTTDEEIKPRIESRGFRAGEDLFVVFSPEREDPGNKEFTMQTVPKVCGGSTEACGRVGVALYGSVFDTVVPVSSTRAAEMTKLLENIHRAVNIGLINEMKIICDRMGIDIYEVIRAAATKPYGFVPYYPGPGLGGHCIPIDPFYLAWKAREYGIHTRFIELAGEINRSIPAWIVGKITDALNLRKKSVSGSRILVLGIAYKKNIDDVRESPAVEIMELLQEKEADISYSDPLVPEFPPMRKHHFDLKSVTLDEEVIAGYDCLVIVTNHDAFDYDLLQRKAKLVIDCRGVYEGDYENVVKA